MEEQKVKPDWTKPIMWTNPQTKEYEQMPAPENAITKEQFENIINGEKNALKREIIEELLQEKEFSTTSSTFVRVEDGVAHVKKSRNHAVNELEELLNKVETLAKPEAEIDEDELTTKIFQFIYTPRHWELGFGFFAGHKFINEFTKNKIHAKPQLSVMFGPYTVLINFGYDKYI